MRIKNIALAGALALTFSNAQAELFDKGGGLIYDDVLKITWLSDANYAQTSGHDADGRMNWTAANAWADNLSFYDSVRNVTYSDWRLPTALNQDGNGSCMGYNCNSEMGHMFYNNMGVGAGGSILDGANNPNFALFTNLQSNVYWSGTAYAPNPANAWGFSTDTGYQGSGYQGNVFYAWAVRDGNVAAPIPEPETYAMLLAGLGLLGVVARRRKQKLNA